MTQIMELLKRVEKGEHKNCTNCPWSPQKAENLDLFKNKKMNFAKNCTECSFDHKMHNNALIMLILQDPYAQGPINTNLLCMNHNQKHDDTAKHGNDIWNAVFEKTSNHYRKLTYQTNAIMHGSKIKSNIDQAKAHCKNILIEQWNIIKPTITITTNVGFKMLTNELKNWENRTFENDNTIPPGVEYRKDPNSNKIVIKIFHLSNTVLNCRANKLYSDNLFNGVRKNEKIQLLIDSYKKKNPNKINGFKVLLRQWIFVADEIIKIEKSLSEQESERR